MRKNFLLLFLMALLPLAGWAEDLTSANVAVGEVEYGSVSIGAPMVVWKGETLTKDTHYSLSDHFYTKDGEDYVDKGTSLATLPIGTYYVKVTGIPANGFNGDAYGPFEIIQKKLTIDFNAIGTTFGDAAVAPTYTVAVKGGADLDPLDDDDAAIIAGLAIAPVVKDGETTITVTTTTAAKAYDFGFTYNTSGNYSLERKAGDADQYVISPKAITAAGMTVNMGTPGTYTYTGNNITGLPTFTVKDGSTTVNTFNVKWFTTSIIDANTPADGDAVEPKNAGTYYARITGTGNYGEKAFDNANWQITVGKVALTVLVNPQSKTYDGVAYTTANVEYTFGGLVDADQGKVNVGTLTPTLDGGLWSDFKDYKAAGYLVGVNAGSATIGDPAIPLSTNYAVTPMSSTWTINKVTGLQITAANQSINYGDVIPATSEITATGAVEAEKAAIEALYKAPAAGSAKNDVYGTQPNIYTPALREVGDPYADAAEKEAAEAVLKNYTFADPAVVAGALNVGGINATIMPVVASAYYDGLAHGATSYLANSGVYVLTTDDIDVTNISYQYRKQNADETWGAWSATAPTAVGVYRAQVVASSVSGKGSFAEAAIAPLEIQYEIKAKPITITVLGAILHKGDTEANLADHTLFDDAYEANLVSGEKIGFEPVFVLPYAGGLTIDPVTEKVTNGAGDVCAGAVIGAPLADLDGYDNANYDITFVPGDLTIANSELVLDPTLEMALTISEAAATGEDYDISFNTMEMNAKEWYALVLPFATTPADLVGELGTYVVVNRLKSSSIDANGVVNVKFAIEMDEIPAGEPFLIKAAKDVDWGIIGSDLLHPAISVAAADLNGVIDPVPTAKATFTGTYSLGNSVKWGENLDGTENADAKYRWLAHKEYKGDNTWKNPKSNAHDLSAMEAYLVLDPAATKANVFVEDFDFESGTTAIKSLSADEVHGMTVNGMYNLNGMKMQNAPTQKGVYIMNGKKVVIK